MGMANDLDARGGTREERNKERNEREKRTATRAQGRGRDLQTTYYANDATITSQFPAGCLPLVLYYNII